MSFARLTHCLSGLALAWCCGAAAQVYEYQWIDATGGTKSAKPDRQWYGPKASSNISITTIAGLDRRVKVELLQGGSLISEQVSPLLTAVNRITSSDGTEFYGAKFSFPAPADGAYVVRATVYDVAGVQVSSNNYAFNVDTIAPALGEFSWSMNYGGGTGPGGIPAFSTTEAKKIALAATDDRAGIGAATFTTLREDGSVYSTGSVTVVPGAVQLGTGSMGSVNTSHIPSEPGRKNTIQMVVTDKAGNSATKSLEFWNNSVCHVPGPQAVAIFDPAATTKYLDRPELTGFVEITGATPVATNPAKVLFRALKSNVRGEPGGSLGGITQTSSVSFSKTYDDGTYAYYTASGTIGLGGSMDWPHTGWTDYSTWRCAPLRVPAPSFSASAMPPVITGVRAHFDNYGWISGGYRDYRSTKIPGALSTVEVAVQARAFDQAVSVNMLGTCTVPAGQTVCSIATTQLLCAEGSISGNQYWTNVTKVGDSALRAEMRNLDVFCDNQPPQINLSSIAHNTVTKEVSFSVSEIASGSVWGYVNIATAGLIAVNKSSGVETTLAASSITTTGNISAVAVNYKGLADGNYDIYTFGRDRSNNTSRAFVAAISNDGTPPTIQFKYNDSVMPEEIADLRLVRVILADSVDSSPVIKTVTLSGGPLAESLQLGYSKQGDGWELELPRMFPSLEAGQEYRLDIAATDAGGNGSVQSATLSLKPENLASLGVRETFALSTFFSNYIDESLGDFKLKNVKKTSGELAQGNQLAMITLRKDSPYPIFIKATAASVTLNPGETKELMLNFVNGEATIRFRPAADSLGKPTAAGDANFMIYLPQIVTN